MKILIACHCKSSFYNNYEEDLLWSPELVFKSTIIDSADIEISYIDTNEDCPDYGKPLQYRDWSEIPHNLFDYIWFEYCPLWGSKKIARDILGAALLKVKPNGKIITGYNGEAHKRHMEDVLKFRKVYKTPFTYEIINKEELPFEMVTADHTLYERGTIYQQYFIFTKTQTGGKRKSKRQLRPYYNLTRKMRR